MKHRVVNIFEPASINAAAPAPASQLAPPSVGASNPSMRTLNPSIGYGSYSERKLPQNPVYRPEMDTKSEPAKRHRERTVKYTAFHKPDGSVQLSRANSFGGFKKQNLLQRRPSFVPPLDLRDFNSSRKQYPSTERLPYKPNVIGPIMPAEKKRTPKHGAMSRITEEMNPASTQPPTYPSQPQSLAGSQANGAVTQLPPLSDPLHGYRAPYEPVLQEEEEEAVQSGGEVDDSPRPESSASQTGYQSGNTVPDIQVASPEPDPAWQVNRASARGQRDPYSPEY